MATAPAPMGQADARRAGLAARRDLTPAQRAERSALVVAHLADLDELTGAPGSGGLVASYRALPEEVDPAGIEAVVRERGWALCLPRVTGAGGMSFVRWEPDAPWVTNSFGIQEVHGPPVDVAALSVVLVPCVAVDDAGTRVGFGAGFYDRALASDAPVSPLRIGLAFEVQVLERLERRSWDLPMDLVVTDRGVIRPG